MKPLKVFFGFTQNSAVAWYRFIQFAKHMKGAEVAYSKFSPIDSEMVNWQSDILNPVILRQIEMLMSTADVSVLGAFRDPMGVALVQAIKHKYKKPVLMEIDDYVFNLPSYNVASKDYTANGQLEFVLRKQIEVSDGLIVSTPALKELYSNIHKNIFVIPNSIDIDQWSKVRKHKKPKGSNIRIGFAGSPNHAGDLRILRGAIGKILAKYPEVEFYFWGPEPDFLSHERLLIDGDWVPIDKFPKKLGSLSFDIAIAPLKDNNFNRGKSNLRLIENSMLKTPVVASPLPDYVRTIKHGKTGYLCNTESEWVESLSKLIEKKSLRKEIGENAYKFVCKEYDIKNTAKDYVKILTEFKK